VLESNVRNVLNRLSPDERQNLEDWLEELLEIRRSSESRVAKINALRSSLRKSTSLWPVLRVLAEACKQYGWDERKGAFRAFAAGSVGGMLLVGFQGAGLAALGGAVGFPLWIVFGGGATVAYAILRELRAP
jgi:hypothetical protein